MKKTIALIVTLALMTAALPAMAADISDLAADALKSLIGTAGTALGGAQDDDTIVAESASPFYGSWSLSSVVWGGRTYTRKALAEMGYKVRAHVTITEGRVSASGSVNDIKKSGSASIPLELTGGAISVTLAGEHVTMKLTSSGQLKCSAMGATAYFSR